MNPLHEFRGGASQSPPAATSNHHHHPQNPGPYSSAMMLPSTPVVEIGSELPSDRKCTNVGWTIGFLMFVLGACFIAVHALLHGQTNRLHKGVNFNGLVCGVDERVSELPFLFFPLDPSSSKPTLLLSDARCVAFCPSEADVIGKRTIPITRRATHADKDSSSALTLEYELQTLLYATTPVANAYCIPEDANLRHQVLPVLTTTWRQLSFAVGSLTAAWPVVLSYSLFAAVLSIASNWFIKRLPVITVYSSLVAVVATMVGGGSYLLSWGMRGGNGYNDDLFSANYCWTCVFGAISLLGGMAAACLILNSRTAVSRACRVAEMTGDVLLDMPNVIISPLISFAVLFVFMWVWIAVLLHICGLGAVTVEAEFLPLGRNGSVGIIPLHRHLIFPFGGLIAILYWLFALFWILQVVKALTQFVFSYTGTVWYFAPPEGSDDRDVGWCPALVAMSVCLGNHLGSMALGGLVMGITAPIRTLCSWASARHDYGADAHVVFLTQVFSPILMPLRSIVDFFSTAGYVEMSISSTTFWTAMVVSSRRLGVPASPCARLSGTMGLVVGNSVAGAIALIASLLTFASLSTTEFYTTPTSELFVSSPIFVSLITFIFSWAFASNFTDMWSCLADSLFYCYLVESTGPGGRVDETPGDKIHAQPSLRDLVLETMDEMDFYGEDGM